MSEALCQCGHEARHHSRGKCNTNACCGNEKCDDTFTPPPTREPIRLTDEAEVETAAEVWHQWVLDEEPGLPPEWWDITRRAVTAGFRAARLAGLGDLHAKSPCNRSGVQIGEGPTLAAAWDEGFDKGAHYASADLSHATYRTPPPANPYRTPESEDTE